MNQIEEDETIKKILDFLNDTEPRGEKIIVTSKDKIPTLKVFIRSYQFDKVDFGNGYVIAEFNKNAWWKKVITIHSDGDRLIISMVNKVK